MTKEEYKNSEAPTQSFYEKLLLLKDKMNTEPANKLRKKDTAIWRASCLSFMQNGGREIRCSV
jgi:HD superfamily phosphodiesterase